jgi:predicted AlkP superfamily phosphohydrolase/phosphomutase
LLPETVRSTLSPLHRAAIGELPPFDWKHTRVFRLPSVGNSYLRVNLAGREPQGIVAPGAEYEAVLGEIAARFGALVNPETGEPAVEGVYFPATQFTGPLAQELPDAAILWNAKAPINSITSPEIGVIEGRQISDRTGNHRPEGFALLHGPAFAGGPASSNVDARTIAPFVTEYFGVAMPAISETESGVRVAGADRYRVVLDACVPFRAPLA